MPTLYVEGYRDLEGEPAAPTRCAPCAATFFALLSFALGPLAALVTIGFAVHVIRHDQEYSAGAQAWTVLVAVLSVLIAAGWLLLITANPI